MKHCHFVSSALLSLVVTCAIGAEPASNAVSVAEIVAEALEKNPELKFYEAELAAAKAGRKSAGVLANPEVSGELGHKNVRGSDPSGEGVAWAVSVVQPFEWPGRMGLRKAIANRDVELAELGVERFKAALAARVRSLAFGVFAARQKAAAAEEVAERFSALSEVLVQRDPAGLTPVLETRVIEATTLTARRKASEAAIAERIALLELNQLRGIPATERSTLIRDTQTPLPPAPDVRSLLAAARTNNFELRSRELELAQQGLRVSLARNERYPSISVGPSYSEERAGGERERIVSMAMSVPVPVWNRNAGNIRAAEARQAQAEAAMTVTERNVERQIVTASETYQAKLREMEKWRPDAVQHLQQAAELADRHYRLGAVPVATYVELQQQYLEAVDALLDTRREALEAAGQLELLTGIRIAKESEGKQ